ncbi:hypothetical protein D3C77_378500 [compost metagenome]
MLFDPRNHRDVTRGADQQVIASLELATDDADVSTTVQSDASAGSLAGIDGQVMPRFDHRGDVGAVVAFLLLATAAT